MRKRWGSGLSLLEVIFASFIFSGLVTVLSSMWIMHARSQRQTGLVLVAADLAELEMTRSLGMGYHGVTPSTGSYTQSWEVRGQMIDHVFTTQVEVTPLEDQGGDPVPSKLISVTVTCDDESDIPPQKLSLSGVITDEN